MLYFCAWRGEIENGLEDHDWDKIPAVSWDDLKTLTSTQTCLCRITYWHIIAMFLRCDCEVYARYCCQDSVCLSNACIVTKRKHLAKKVQLWLIGSRPRAFQWAEDEKRTLPLNPQFGYCANFHSPDGVLYVPVVERTHHNYMPAFRLSVTLWWC